MNHLNVLSLFDGMSCGRLALERAGIDVVYYAASEIDKPAMMVTKHNFFDTDFVGDVCDLNPYDFRNVNLIMGGSPCQSMSPAGKRGGLTTNDGQVVDSLEKYLMLKSLGYSYDKSSLMYFNSSVIFWEFVRMYRGIKKYNPNLKFLLENVVNKEWAKLITKELGVEPIHINSRVVTPQNRDRFYWTNIEYTPIQEKEPTLDLIIPDAISGAGTRGVPQKNWVKTPENPFLHVQKTTVRKDGLANCLTASGGKICRKYLSKDGTIKVINAYQAEMLQTVPVGYTDVPGVSEHQRFKMLGNGWTVDVIAHIFSCLKNEIVRKYPMWTPNS
jgi:DNA (cytosine-5)-methyltransferase 3A